MTAVSRFEDLDAWAKSRELTRLVYAVTSSERFRHDYALRDQMRRCAVSLMSNIAEGFERDGNREFAQFLSLAKGSVGELRAQLYVAFDAGYLTEQEFDEARVLAERVSRMLSGLRRYILGSDVTGRKYAEGRSMRELPSIGYSAYELHDAQGLMSQDALDGHRNRET